MKPEALEANLKQAAKDLQQPKPLFDAVGTTLVSRIRPHVRVRSGRLQGSITDFISNDTLFVGSDVEYAEPVDSRYPFMQPGLDDSMSEIDQETADWADKLLDKVGQ